MKKITFTRYGKTNGWRQSTGYLLTSFSHPGRMFVVARGSVRKHGVIVDAKDRWALFDLDSGYCLNSGAGKTRAEAQEHALSLLCTRFTPEHVADRIRRSREAHVEKELRQAA